MSETQEIIAGTVCMMVMGVGVIAIIKCAVVPALCNISGWIRDKFCERKPIEVDLGFGEGTPYELTTHGQIAKMHNRLDAMHEDWIKQPSTATCHICGKRDFMDNLADVGWMEDFTFIGSLHAHPSCAHIKRSDDGKGWVRVKK